MMWMLSVVCFLGRLSKICFFLYLLLNMLQIIHHHWLLLHLGVPSKWICLKSIKSNHPKIKKQFLARKEQTFFHIPRNLLSIFKLAGIKLKSCLAGLYEKNSDLDVFIMKKKKKTIKIKYIYISNTGCQYLQQLHLGQVWNNYLINK